MKISSNFAVARPREQVWAMFQDVPRVAACIPGTRITDARGDGTFSGTVEVKLGPITAIFEGDADHVPDPAEFTGTITGNGRDRGAGSRARFTTVYRLTATATGTDVAVDSDVSLAGAIAQFGRTGLMQEVTNRMLQQFAANLDAQMAADTAPAAADTAAEPPVRTLNLGALLWASLVAWLRAQCGRRRAAPGERPADDEPRAS